MFPKMVALECVRGSQGLLVLLYFWVKCQEPLVWIRQIQARGCLPSRGSAGLVEQRDCVTRGGLGLPGRVGDVTPRRRGTSLEGEGHAPLRMLDRGRPCPSARDDGRGWPRGTTTTLLCERGGQCKIRQLFEGGSLHDCSYYGQPTEICHMHTLQGNCGEKATHSSSSLEKKKTLK